MDRLKKNRTVVRSTFTKVYNNLEHILAEEDIVEIQAQMEILESKHEELLVLDKQIYEELLDNDMGEEEIVSEVRKSDEYTTLFKKMKIRVNKMIKTESSDMESIVSEQLSNATRLSQQGSTRQRNFRLPVIEITKFDGKLINWLQFWAQFSKIHNDSNIANEDKFQYLFQSIEPNNRAYDLVSSFPPTSSNYEKAIEGLKSRFGKEDLLVEVYVRELLKLVLQNVLDKQYKMSLQVLYDKLESHLRAIDSLGVTTDKCAAMLFPLVESCMPEDLLRAWQRSSLHVGGGEAKTRLDNLMKFMRSEVEGEQRIGLAMSSFGLESYRGKSVKKGYESTSAHHRKLETPSAASLVSTGGTGVGRPKANLPLFCIFCAKSHKSQDCFLAQKMSLDERRKVLNEKGACYCCFRLGHNIKDCKANVKCVWCKKKHFLLMCSRFQYKSSDKIESRLNEEIKFSDHNQGQLEQSTDLANKVTEVGLTSKVFMQTLLVNAFNPENGSMKPARVLFDSGSQQSYVSKELAEAMGYVSLGKQTIVHTLFGNVKSKEQVHQRYKLHIDSRVSNYTCELEVLDQPVICGDVPRVPSGPWLKEMFKKNIVLTDVNAADLPISILIGADTMGRLLTGKRIPLSCGLVAIQTLLGWTVMGRLNGKSRDVGQANAFISMFVRDSEVTDLWDLDVIGIRDPCEHKSKQDKDLTIKHDFLSSTKVNKENRYEVVLPWAEGHESIPSNKKLAEARLSGLLKKLDKDRLYYDYDGVLNQWLEESIIEKVPENEIDNVLCHYLPHRPVIKESSSTTRIRPVFDASAHEVGKPSLNDCLERGVNMIELIPSIMMRFREGKVGVIADIRKAFLQISIHPQDRDYLRFIWYKKHENKFEIYRHRRVVFGLKCSPFLLGAVIDLHLQQACSVERKQEFESCMLDKLTKSFYVDNVSTSFDTQEEGESFKDYATKVMAKGKFDLRSWEITGSLSDPDSMETNVKVLGINWNTKEDVLFINLDFLKEFNPLPLTKRKMLSIAHQIFDPIGYICPVTLRPKLLLQETWKKEIGWDTEVDEEILSEFLKWFKCLPLLEEIRIPRWIGKITTKADGCTLHIFCDGSKGAYATVIYLRVATESGVSIQLISAKSRVVPLKEITIPRIELLAATVGVRLAESVRNTMDWTDITSYYWTDSTTVLAWIKQDKKWKVFVQNRVNEIRKLTKVDQWNFVPGEMNPADLPSRGCDAEQLLNSRWHEGPLWLKHEMSFWPSFNSDANDEDIYAETSVTLKTTDCFVQGSLNGRDKVVDWATRYFSQYLKIIRMVAWIYRFKTNCKLEVNSRNHQDLTAKEIEGAELCLFKLVQEETLSGLTDKKIATLNPIIDENGLIRLETKLCNKEDTYAFRYPIVLSPKHRLVVCLIIHYHENNCHAGVQVLLSILRENYWILGGRRALRSIISKCVRCKRHKARNLEAKTGMLPSNRLRESAVFEVVGTDYAGPIYLKKNCKAWICLFTCAVYRALHLELVTSLTTDAFLQAFRRFIARRGRPCIVYSDNGTNYVGASNALKGINWDEIRKYSSAQRIEWRFNPPTAAWWGGWWERLVRLTKELLRRVLGRAYLSYQEMTTVLCDCESVINSRPLTYISESESDLLPLTPNHFLHDVRHFGVPDIDKIEETSLNNRQKYLSNLRSDLRKRFRSEYLGQLVQKSNPNAKYADVRVGDVVLMECEKKRIDWPLCVVIEKLPDKRGITRLVKIKTSNGVLLRPVQKLYPLEVSAEDLTLPTRDKASNIKTKSVTIGGGMEEKTSRSGRTIRVPKKYTVE